MKTSKRIASLVLTFIILLTLAGCGAKENQYWDYSWDGTVGERTGDDSGITGDAEETNPFDGENEENVTEEKPSDESSNDTTDAVTENKSGSSSSSGNSGNASSGNANSGSGSSGKSGSGSSSGSNSGSAASSGSSSGSKSGSSSEGSSSELPTDTASIVAYYKKAANPVKQLDGVTVARYREILRDNGGNMSGVAAALVKKAFAPKDVTEEKHYDTKKDVVDGFIVKGESYVCDLSPGDVKSATIKKSGDNYVVRIDVKDDTDGTNYSNKAISAQAIADTAKPLSMGMLKSVSCKNVYIIGTINAKGQLIDLKTYGDFYLYGKNDEYFSFYEEHQYRIMYS